MGKNTMMRKAIRGHLEKNPDLERLMPHIKQNVGFVFTKMELLHVRDLLLSNKVKAPAKAGALAPVDVVVPAQNTGIWHRSKVGAWNQAKTVNPFLRLTYYQKTKKRISSW